MHISRTICKPDHVHQTLLKLLDVANSQATFGEDFSDTTCTCVYLFMSILHISHQVHSLSRCLHCLSMTCDY